MKKHTKKINFIILNRIIIAGLLIAGSVEVVLLSTPQGVEPVVQAQEGGAAAQTEASNGVLPSDVANACVSHMKNFMFDEKQKFGKFINEHFRSKEPTSVLIPAAIEEFRKYRQTAREEISKFNASKGKGLSQEAAIVENDSCNKAIEEDFVLMKVIIRTHIEENAVAKKSTRLLDKYKQINEKMDKLNFTIGQMAGYFGTLAQKLPCYASKCVKK